MEGWVNTTCGGQLDSYQCPAGYGRTSCTTDPTPGTHSGCPTCQMSDVVCTCGASDDSGVPDGPPDVEPEAAVPCTLVPQSGCGTDMVCDLWQGDPNATTTCRPVTEDGGEQDTCWLDTDCGAGLTCVGYQATLSVCMRFCKTDEDCTAPGGACRLGLSSNGTPIPGVKVCTQNCDPRNNSGCPTARLRCEITAATSDPSEQHGFTACQLAGMGKQNSACQQNADCAADHGCYNTGSTKLCCHYCSNDSDCPDAGASCHLTTKSWTVGTVSYSFCW
jgi:hypothetical protein